MTTQPAATVAARAGATAAPPSPAWKPARTRAAAPPQARLLPPPPAAGAFPAAALPPPASEVAARITRRLRGAPGERAQALRLPQRQQDMQAERGAARFQRTGRAGWPLQRQPSGQWEARCKRMRQYYWRPYNL